VELETSGEKLKVSGGKLTATFAGIAATEFPVMPKAREVPEGKMFKMKKKIIEEVAVQVAFAAAADESRPVLTGVLMQPTGKSLVVTATDGFRLSRKVIVGIGMGGEEKGLIVPARTIMEMARVATEGKKEEMVMGILPETNQIIMEYDEIELMSRVLEGNFPDVEKIIPKEEKCEMVVEREEMLRAIRAAGIFARESANVVRFKIQDSSLVISASSSQTGESEIEIEIEKKGEDGQIAFNYRYVLDYLNSVGADRVTFKMTESLAPGVFGIEGDESLTHIIMPVRV
jgi:DNA polymerase-3 subunit beta